MSQSNRIPVPANIFAPQKARNDVNQEHPKLPLIALNVPLMDLIEHGASVVHGANDLVFRGATYKEYRLYLTVSTNCIDIKLRALILFDY